jgi:hypothetical protein
MPMHATTAGRRREVRVQIDRRLGVAFRGSDATHLDRFADWT